MSHDTVICDDTQQRRADVRAHPDLNGIDYVEVDPADQVRIHVHFLKPVPPANPGNPADPADAYGLAADPTRVTIGGGSRVVGIEVVSVVRHPDGHLEILASEPGDFSWYLLDIRVPELDPFLAHVEFSFKAGCPVDVDCAPETVCPPEPVDEPALDYEAKDYASFRRFLLDLVPRLNPDWTERNPSDLGMALVELLAHTGDHLSYFQDAVANEAYLETARQRISVRRHARLVDYRMHDGRNGWAAAHLRVSASAVLPQGTPFVTRITAPLAGDDAPPGPRVDASSITVAALRNDPALAGAVVFESTHPLSVHPSNNEIRIHSWGNDECCLPRGIREAYLYHVTPSTGEAVRPPLSEGDHILLEEVMGPETGLAADADPRHRQLVRIVGEPEETSDPVYAATLVGGEIQRRQPGDPALPLLRVRWGREDALAFPLCLSTRDPDFDALRNVSVARGNVVLVDQGLTEEEITPLTAPVGGDAPFRLTLSQGPLTLQCQPDTVTHDPASGRLQTERRSLTCEAGEAVPAISLFATFPTGEELWTPVPDLLDSPPFAQHFVAEMDDRGRAILRFGDGEYGRRISGATGLRAVYRVGNGRVGNVGAETLAHVALPGPAGWLEEIRNPLPARDGADPESTDHVRRFAPQAFRARQFRAVTEKDYVDAALTLPEVAGAVASFRWTGSWYTVFVGVDPVEESDLVVRPWGALTLSDELKRKVHATLNRYRLAGYDLEVRPPLFVPLDIAVEVCVHDDHFRADVKEAVVAALGDERLPDGTTGFFHPQRFTFGDPVYLSRLYAAIEAVPGVDSARVRTFKRWGRPADGELAAGVISSGPWEIPLLENDPNFLENGVLQVTAMGGKA